MRAQDLGLLAGSPVTSSWCLSSWRDVIAALDPVAAADPRLLLWEDGALSVYYAPWDWVNTRARVMLVGITPGAYQATEALREAQACLRAGCSSEETLRRAAAVGSFSGPMRRNLVAMLDGVGLADALGVDSTARLFDTHHHLAALGEGRGARSRKHGPLLLTTCPTALDWQDRTVSCPSHQMRDSRVIRVARAETPGRRRPARRRLARGQSGACPAPNNP
jgi:hypothetical protein